MINKKIQLSLALLFGIGISNCYAQQATTATGGDASGSGGSAAYSIGQVVYTTHIGTTGSVAQGVQQPYEISTTTGLKETGINLLLAAFPNPAIDFLTLQVDAFALLNELSLAYQLYDSHGKLLERNTILTSTTTIKMEQYAAATYFLNIFQNNNEIKTFKIIKN